MGRHACAEPPAGPAPSLLRLAGAFAFIGATSFGGGVTGYIRRVVVEERQWLSSEEFLRGLAVAQAVPGPNAVNLAVFIGHRLHGMPGATLAAVSVLVVPVGALSGLALAWSHWGASPGVIGALRALGAFGVGLMAATGVRMWREASFALLDMGLAVAAFVAVGVLRWSVPLVLLTLVPLSLWAHERGGARPHGAGE